MGISIDSSENAAYKDRTSFDQERDGSQKLMGGLAYFGVIEKNSKLDPSERNGYLMAMQVLYRYCVKDRDQLVEIFKKNVLSKKDIAFIEKSVRSVVGPLSVQQKKLLEVFISYLHQELSHSDKGIQDVKLADEEVKNIITADRTGFGAYAIPEIMTNNKGKISSVRIQWPIALSDALPLLTMNYLKSLDKDVSIVIIIDSDDKVKQEEALNELRKSGITNPVEFVMFGYNGGLTVWSRDNCLVLKQDNKTILLEPKGDYRLDPMAADETAKQQGFELQHSSVYFEGGDVRVVEYPDGARKIFIGAESLNNHLNGPTDEARRKAFINEFSKYGFSEEDIIFVGVKDKDKKLKPAVFHIDMATIPLPFKDASGRPVVAINRPSLMIKLLQELSPEERTALAQKMQFKGAWTSPTISVEDMVCYIYFEMSYEELRKTVDKDFSEIVKDLDIQYGSMKAQLEDQGISTVDIPGLYTDKRNSVLSYTNNLFEEFVDNSGVTRRRLYVGLYGVPSLDKAMIEHLKGIYGEPLEIIPLEGADQTALLQGMLNCLTLELDRYSIPSQYLIQQLAGN